MHLDKTAKIFKTAVEDNRYIRVVKGKNRLTLKASQRADLNKIFQDAQKQIQDSLLNFRASDLDEAVQALDDIAENAQALKDRYAQRAGNFFVRKGWIHSRRKSETLKSADALINKALAAKSILSHEEAVDSLSSAIKTLTNDDPQAILNLLKKSGKIKNQDANYQKSLEKIATKQFEELFTLFAENQRGTVACVFDNGHWIQDREQKPSSDTEIMEQLAAYLPYINYKQLALDPQAIRNVFLQDIPQLKPLLLLMRSNWSIEQLPIEIDLKIWRPILFKAGRDLENPTLLRNAYFLSLVKDDAQIRWKDDFVTYRARYDVLFYVKMAVEEQDYQHVDLYELNRILEEGLLKSREFRIAAECDLPFFRCIAGKEKLKSSHDFITKVFTYALQECDVDGREIFIKELVSLQEINNKIKENKLVGEDIPDFLSVQGYLRNEKLMNLMGKDLSFIRAVSTSDRSSNYTVRAIRYAMQSEGKEQVLNLLLTAKKLEGLLATFSAEYVRPLMDVLQSGILQNPEIAPVIQGDLRRLMAVCNQAPIPAKEPASIRLVALLAENLRSGELKDLKEAEDFWNQVVDLWLRKPGLKPGRYSVEDLPLLFRMMPKLFVVLLNPPLQMLQTSDFTTQAVVVVLRKLHAGSIRTIEQAQEYLVNIARLPKLRDKLLSDQLTTETYLELLELLKSGVLEDRDLRDLLTDKFRLFTAFTSDAVPHNKAPFALRAAYVLYKRFGVVNSDHSLSYATHLAKYRGFSGDKPDFKMWSNVSLAEVAELIEFLKDEKHGDLLENEMAYFIAIQKGNPITGHHFYARALACVLETKWNSPDEAQCAYTRLCHAYKLLEELKSNEFPWQSQGHYQAIIGNGGLSFEDLKVNEALNNLITEELGDLFKGDFQIKAKLFLLSIPEELRKAYPGGLDIMHCLNRFEVDPQLSMAQIDDTERVFVYRAFIFLTKISKLPSFEKFTALMPRVASFIVEDFVIKVIKSDEKAESEKINVSLPWVALWSDYFAGLLRMNGKEVIEKKKEFKEVIKKEVEFIDIDAEDLMHMLTFFKTGGLLTILKSLVSKEFEEFEQVIQRLGLIADRLQIPLLKREMEKLALLAFDNKSTQIFEISPRDWRNAGLTITREQEIEAINQYPTVSGLSPDELLFWIPEVTFEDCVLLLKKMFPNSKEQGFASLPESVFDSLKGMKIESGWRVMSKSNLPGTEKLTFDEYDEAVKAFAIESEIEFVVPNALEALCLVIGCYLKSEERLFPETNFTYCGLINEGDPLWLGGFDAEKGLCLQDFIPEGAKIGVTPAYRVPKKTYDPIVLLNSSL